MTASAGRLVFQTWLAARVIAYASAVVFDHEQFKQTFPTLSARQCLPADFNHIPMVAAVAEACEAAATSPIQPPECEGADALGSFFNCLAKELGFLNADGTVLDMSAVVAGITRHSESPQWIAKTTNMLDQCSQNAATGLTARQLTVYTYICLKWSLFADCDLQQQKRGQLDAEGALRRTRFLSGTCPLSPSSLRGVLEAVTGRTLQQCSQKRYLPYGASTEAQYEAEIARIVCLFHKFIGPDGKIDLKRLTSALPCGQSDSAKLRNVVHSCMRTQKLIRRGVYEPLTAEEFAMCFADKGTLSCVYQEANQVATVHPHECDVTIPA